MTNTTLSVDVSSAKRTSGLSLDTNFSTLTRQILAYVPARLIPGLINFLALALYTRWLSTEAYGRYAFVLATIGLAHVVAFWWLRMGLFRFFQGAQRNNRLPALLSTATAVYVIISLFVSLIWISALTFFPVEAELKAALWLGLPLLLVYELFEQLLEMNRADLASTRYGILAAGRSMLSLAAALAFIVLFGQNEQGLLLGLILGAAVPVLVDLPRWIAKITPRLVERAMAANLLRYGMPLMITFALDFIISTSNRFLLKYFLGAESVGLYAVGYDLTNQTLTMLFHLVNLAAFPLIVRALEQTGREEAQAQLRQYSVLLVALVLPASAGLALIAPSLSAVMLGESFQQIAQQLIPWIALSTFLMGIKIFYFDLAFQLGLRTDLQIWTVAAAALLCAILNIWWIPIYGIMGAAYATIAAYALALAISIGLGYRIFPMPFPAGELSRIMLATLLMSGLLWLLNTGDGVIWLGITVALSATIYLAAIWVMDVAHMRQRLVPVIRQFSKTPKRDPE